MASHAYHQKRGILVPLCELKGKPPAHSVREAAVQIDAGVAPPDACEDCLAYVEHHRVSPKE
jgi:hypothetical protein